MNDKHFLSDYFKAKEDKRVAWIVGITGLIVWAMVLIK